MVGFSEIEDETRVSEWIEFRVGRASSNDAMIPYRGWSTKEHLKETLEMCLGILDKEPP